VLEVKRVAEGEIFDAAATTYESWYATPEGRRTHAAECDLLAWLLEPFTGIDTVLEIGCGTGHFTRWLADRGLNAYGLDRSLAMVQEMRSQGRDTPAVIGDAHCLPVRSRAVDLCIFVTTLEFLGDPELALREATRVAISGIVVLTLNSWSLGGLSRRWDPQARDSVRPRANAYSIISLKRTLERATGARLHSLRWRSSLSPGALYRMRTRIPLGDVLGVAVRLL
jgi:ubiquinone/menaquinone biosynthesis C-methylase UbiE